MAALVRHILQSHWALPEKTVSQDLVLRLESLKRPADAFSFSHVFVVQKYKADSSSTRRKLVRQDSLIRKIDVKKDMS